MSYNDVTRSEIIGQNGNDGEHYRVIEMAEYLSRVSYGTEYLYERFIQNGELVMNDPVKNPKHYTEHPSGIECIQVTEHMSFNLGNALKYIWRCDLKLDAIEDLKKAVWYLEREISKREASKDRRQ